jgi:hypothetical protein
LTLLLIHSGAEGVQSLLLERFKTVVVVSVTVENVENPA